MCLVIYVCNYILHNIPLNTFLPQGRVKNTFPRTLWLGSRWLYPPAWIIITLTKRTYLMLTKLQRYHTIYMQYIEKEILPALPKNRVWGSLNSSRVTSFPTTSAKHNDFDQYFILKVEYSGSGEQRLKLCRIEDLRAHITRDFITRTILIKS